MTYAYFGGAVVALSRLGVLGHTDILGPNISAAMSVGSESDVTGSPNMRFGICVFWLVTA